MESEDTGAVLHSVQSSSAAPRTFLARGRKPNLDFERAVMAHLVYMTVEKAHEEGVMKKHDLEAQEARADALAGVVANCLYSYELVRTAVAEERLREKWQSDKSVQGLKLSDGWIRGMLDRYKFSRRRCTGIDKTSRPAPEAVRATMTAIQRLIVEKNLPLGAIWNGDE